MLAKKIKRSSNVSSNRLFSFKTAKYEIQKNPKFLRNIVWLQVLVQCFSFFILRDQLVAQQKCLFQVKESCNRVLVFFEPQILSLLLVFHRAPNLSLIHANQINLSARYIPPTCNIFFLLRDLARQVEKAKHRLNVARQFEGFYISYFAEFS